MKKWIFLIFGWVIFLILFKAVGLYFISRGYTLIEVYSAQISFLIAASFSLLSHIIFRK